MKAATHFSASRKPPQTDTSHVTPRIARSGQRRSPTVTPTASGQACRNPPESARAVSATQTGPGVKNRMRSAPA
jgi:hypothetical protein